MFNKKKKKKTPPRFTLYIVKCHSWTLFYIYRYRYIDIYRYLYHRQSSLDDCGIEVLFIHDAP